MIDANVFSRRIMMAVAGLIVSSSSVMAQNSNPNRPEIGKALPVFSLPSIEDGKMLSLSEYRGKKLLLFHFASC